MDHRESFAATPDATLTCLSLTSPPASQDGHLHFDRRERVWRTHAELGPRPADLQIAFATADQDGLL